MIMKNTNLIKCLIILGLINVQYYTISQTLPSKEKTLETMVLANKYFMEKWPDVGKRIVTTASRASNIWTRGVYYEGLMELYKLIPDTQYLNYAIRWAEFHKWNLRAGT